MSDNAKKWEAFTGAAATFISGQREQFNAVLAEEMPAGSEKHPFEAVMFGETKRRLVREQSDLNTAIDMLQEALVCVAAATRMYFLFSDAHEDALEKLRKLCPQPTEKALETAKSEETATESLATRLAPVNPPRPTEFLPRMTYVKIDVVKRARELYPEAQIHKPGNIYKLLRTLPYHHRAKFEAALNAAYKELNVA